MAIDTTVPRSRRALLGAALGAAAATAASAVARPLTSRAADGQTVLVGGEYTSSTPTKITSGATNGSATIWGVSTIGFGVSGVSGSGYGVDGHALSGIGVHGSAVSGTAIVGRSESTSAPAILGRSNGHRSGVVGYSGTGVDPTAPAKVGVYGLANQDSSARGVFGSSPLGTGVRGASTSGPGVHGTSSTQTGVRGVSTSGYGVSGQSGTSVGVKGTTSTGIAVVGDATSPTGPTRGVSALSGSPDGIGVEGENYATSGEAVGIEGRSYSPDGYAVRGTNKASSGGAGVAGFAQGTFGESSGVLGQVSSPDGYGVLGDTLASSTSARAIVGHAPAGTAVMGWIGTGATPAGRARTAIYGRATGSLGARGVHGYTTSGIGVLAEATVGTALQVTGRAVFSRSGRVTVTGGSTQATKTGVPLTSSSLVLATIQGAGESGLYVRNVSLSVAGSSFTIRLSKAPAADTSVAWFVVN